MAEPRKEMYDEPFLRQFGALVRSEWASFDDERFVQLVVGDGWDRLELKGRIRRVTEALGSTLPPGYAEALDVLFAIDERCVGFPFIFFPDFVEVNGLGDWKRSMEALERFTARSTSEFAIRPFLVAETERTMARMREWAEHENEHVRRLASEGCRPRLPWASALTMFKRDPRPIMPILEQLKCDSSLYVRKSVANNINDIAKDHPDIVRDVAARWSGEHPLTDWIVRRGCRTLIRQADPVTMALFGYSGASAADAVGEARIDAQQKSAFIGGSTELRYRLVFCDTEPQRLRIELGVDYVKASGRVSQKRFLLTDRTVAAGSQLEGSKRLDWTDLSTRKHYPGLHRLHLTVNGDPVAETEVMLLARGAGEEEVLGTT
ncbi:DNA alkylation repair protein [Paenibacillus sp. sptzw28]|uniref:DNA alkylation repair protein n=1 Tax=Paenibacillus sp. sptzw28 TaxID=715179 RepID=UPI001C6DEB07|nr:DNA alkylation repair protein [Paenibacillus sp. sptzw28]QYR21326.1 DNA alkylation repair protein [Paenibacillus sp. sptzw28]